MNQPLMPSAVARVLPWLFGLLTVFSVLCWLTPSVYAGVRKEAVIANRATVIPSGELVEDVLVIGHSVKVVGEVSEILVVIDGDVHLTSSSRTGIVVDLGGRIAQDAGAHVNAIYHASLFTPFWDGALFGVAFALVLWAAMLAGSILLMVAVVLFTLGLRSHLLIPLQEMEASLRRVGVIGLLMTVAVSAFDALCAVAIVALPLAGTVTVVYSILGLIGLTVVSLWIGKWLTRHRDSEVALWKMGLIGSSVLIALLSVPFVGLVLLLVGWMMGVGAVTAWGVGAWRSRRLAVRT